MARIALAVAWGLTPSSVLGQRTAENVILSADDAYGTSVGRDSIGLYRSGWVRGFSPTVAGNARIDGLYFDQVWSPSQRISTGTKVRVGLSVFGSPFPAPTGVVDYQLRRPDDRFAANVFGAYDSFGGYLAESDVSLPVSGERLSLGIGLAAYRKAFHNGTNAEQLQGSVIGRWRPGRDKEILAFASRSQELSDEVGVIYVPAGSFLPPRAQRRRHIGPTWAVHRGSATNFGLISASPVGDWSRLRLGIFRSVLDNAINFSNVLADLQPNGIGRHVVTADPDAKTSSTSGEARWTLIKAGERLGQSLHVSIRARARRREYGGSAAFDLGPIRLDEQQTAAKPSFTFGAPTRDRVNQITAGLAYELRLPRRVEADLSVQYSQYTKTTSRPYEHPLRSRSGEILGSAALAAFVTPRLVVYGSYARGLEEGGLAPVSARNRNEAAPAIVTNQADGGLRWEVTRDLKAIAAVFQVEKPYYSVGASNNWGRIGSVRNRGVEFSLAGKLRPDLSIVAGAALMDPRVIEESVNSSGAGRRPVDVPRTTLLASADWQVPGREDLSFGLGGTYTGSVAATLNNEVRLPSRLILDASLRYRFRLDAFPASARLQISNLADAYGFTSRGSGLYALVPGRQFTLSLTIDR